MVGVDLATIQFGDLGLKVGRTLDPAVVHLLAVQALIERGAVLLVERVRAPMVSGEIVDETISHVELFSQTLSYSSTPMALMSMAKLLTKAVIQSC